MRAAIAVLCLLFLVGCSRSGGLSRTSRSPSVPGMVETFGTFSAPDGGLKLVVTKHEKSLVRYQVVTASGELVNGPTQIGSDMMRWFFFWESPDILWAYGADYPYFERLEFVRGNGVPGVKVTKIEKKHALPREVWNELSPSVRENHPIAVTAGK